MSPRQLNRALILCGFLVLVAWTGLMVSFWLPGTAGDALMASALTLGIPPAVLGALGLLFFTELTEGYEQEKPLRCTDCGTKILNAGGSTIGDQIEGEVLNLPTVREPHRDPW